MTWLDYAIIGGAAIAGALIATQAMIVADRVSKEVAGLRGRIVDLQDDVEALQSALEPGQEIYDDDLDDFDEFEVYDDLEE